LDTILNHPYLILTSTLFLLCAGVPSFAQQTAQIDAIFKPLVTSDSPGVAVAVIRDGQVIFARGYGLADLKTRTPITASTNFRLASVTKQFTAMAIMLLVHDGKLRYEDTLTKIFPEFPPYGSAITVRSLLNHTSGLKHYEDIYDRQIAGIPPAEVAQLHDRDVLRMLEQQSSGDFAPGSRWEYSNSGYAVLAMIVERISGEPIETFLAKRIFAQTRMSHTVAYVRGENEVPNRAFGYRKSEKNSWEFADQSPTSAVLGDGGIYSSVEDLAKWDKALQQHTLLSAKELQPAVTPVRVPGGVKLPDGAPGEYGFGWFLNPYKGHRRMWHYGDTSGFHTTIQRFPDDNLTIVILANRTDLDPATLALQVSDLYLK
jgi:CubicO group peptidase (beta-lactamase class C family)